MNLSSYEKETIIVFNESDNDAEIFTHNGRMLRELEKLITDRPDDVQHVKDNDTGGSTYRVPKKWVKIRASRILTDEQKEKAAERMRQLHTNQK